MPYIASTLTNSQAYTIYSKPKDAGSIPQVLGEVTVEGGAGVANNKSLITPQGVVTEVSAEQLDQLKKVELFQTHMENGYLTILDKKPADVESVAADMQRGDGSAPLTHADFPDEDDKVKPQASGTAKRR